MQCMSSIFPATMANGRTSLDFGCGQGAQGPFCVHCKQVPAMGFNSPSSRTGDEHRVGESSVAFLATAVAGMRLCKPKNRIASANRMHAKTEFSAAVVTA